jgi:hypothetical protein
MDVSDNVKFHDVLYNADIFESIPGEQNSTLSIIGIVNYTAP